MKIPSFALAAVLCCGAVHNTSAREVQIRHAAEIEFETEPGQYYQLQRTTNFVDWLDIDDRIYGHGGYERRLRSTRPEDGIHHEYYRVVITPAPTNGFAPWTFSGLNIQLDDQPGGDVLQFLTETTGVDLGVVPDPFAYTFTRTGTNEVRIETHPPTYYFDRRNVYLFSFTGIGRGTWVRDEFRRGQLKDRDVGVFSYNTGGTNGPSTGTHDIPVLPTTIPSSATGLAYTFRSGQTPDRLEFKTAIGGTEFGDDVGDNEPNNFSYTYGLTSSNMALIKVTFKVGKWDEYVLTYSSPAQGSFIRREYKDGVLNDIDTGAFSVAVMPIDTSTPPDTTEPPTAPTGFTYTLLSGVIPERLVFHTSTTGIEYDDSSPSEFTYVYASKGANSFSLRVQLKADRWDEYDLTFAAGRTGQFVRREFDKNLLKDTDSGPFTVAVTLP